jgi:hypothetical protein
MRINDVVRMIRGPKGTIVTLTVQKPDKRILPIPITRDVVVVEESYARGALLNIGPKLGSFGYINLSQANSLITSRLTNLIVGGLGGPPLFGAALPSPNWVLTGGFQFGCTDGSGRISNNFGGAFGSMVQAFVATKTPAWGFPNPGCAPPTSKPTAGGHQQHQCRGQFSDYAAPPVVLPGWRSGLMTASYRPPSRASPPSTSPTPPPGTRSTRASTTPSGRPN